MRRSKNLLNQQLTKAIESGMYYVSENRSNDGMWRDFNTLAGESSEWVTAYILSHLLTISHSDSIDIAHKQMSLRQRKNGGWGYNNNVPSDADSTAWTILAFATLPLWRPSAIIRAAHFVEDHFD